MRVDSLVRLRSIFRSWRSQKKYSREPVPEALMERARRATVVHGVGAVIRATGVQHRNLREKGESNGRRVAALKSRITHAGRESITGVKRTKIGMAAPAPSYSRVEIPVVATPTRPVAEVETPSGVKIRVFALTPETLGFLAALSSPGRVS